MATEPIDVADAMEQALNAHDLDGFVEFLADDVRVTGSGPPMQSREEVKQSFATLIRAFPDLQVERRLLFGAGEWVAHEAEASGTHTGPLLRPDGSELAPTHRKARWGISGFLRIEDGEVIEVHQYSDQLALLGQLGVIPAPRTAETSASKHQ